MVSNNLDLLAVRTSVAIADARMIVLPVLYAVFEEVRGRETVLVSPALQAPVSP